MTLYSCEKNKKKYIAVYIIALFFTFSTTGYIALMWIGVSYMLFNNEHKRRLGLNVLYFFIVLIIVLLLYLARSTELFDFVFGKIDRTNGSYIARLAGFVINYEIAIDYPLFGIGSDMRLISDEFINRSLQSEIVLGWTRHNTNTLMYQFAAYGIPFGLIFAINTFGFGKKMVKGVLGCISVFVTIVLLYTGENLYTSILPYIIVFYGASSFGVDKAVNTEE